MVRTRIIHLRLGHVCMVCKDTTQNGLYVFNDFLCATCEEEIVKSDVKTKIYDYYVNQVKTVSSYLYD